ncbi:MAG: 3-oxoacyl-ACP synthase [Nanoarchaeota archaeon]|nr:3-oxoacyl-ACP synthase [Nanoarchaeota archaeon]
MGDFYIRLSAPGVYIPSRGENDINVITNADLERIVNTSDEWITTRTGIKERRISHDLGVHKIAVLAAKDVLEKIHLDPTEIDEINFATNRHYKEQEFRNLAAYVAINIGARTENIALEDSAAGCTGLIYAIRKAYNTLKVEEDKKNILVIGAENLPDMTDYSDRNTCILFGAGACAYLLKRVEGKKEGIIKCTVGGKPDKGDKDWPDGFLGLKYKNGLKIRPSKDPNKKFETYPKKQNYLIMKGKEIMKFAPRAMMLAVHKVLEGTPYSIENVNVIIPHGANARITNNAEKDARKKGFSGTVFTNLDKYGNTSTASVGIAEAEAREKRVTETSERKIIEPGDLVIDVAFGAGLTWGAILKRAS